MVLYHSNRKQTRTIWFTLTCMELVKIVFYTKFKLCKLELLDLFFTTIPGSEMFTVMPNTGSGEKLLEKRLFKVISKLHHNFIHGTVRKKKIWLCLWNWAIITISPHIFQKLHRNVMKMVNNFSILIWIF